MSLKFLGFIFWFISFSGSAWAQSELYVGPYAGDISYNPAEGSAGKQNVFTYGGEVVGFLGHWALGAEYLYSDLGTSGTSFVNVHQVNQWYSGQVRYRLWTDAFTPYAFVTAGAINQDIKTTVSGVTEDSSGTFFVPSIGLGFLARFSRYIGLDISARYYQYSNTSGFNYGISIGYFPSF